MSFHAFVITLLWVSVLARGAHQWNEGLRNEQIADLVIKLKPHVTFDYVLILIVFNDAVKGNKHCPRMANYPSFPLTPSRADRTWTAQQIAKELSKKGIFSKILRLSVSVKSNDFEDKSALQEFQDNSFGMKSGGITPLVLMPHSDLCLHNLLAQWWIHVLFDSTFSVQFLWLLILHGATIEDYTRMLYIQEDSMFMVATKRGLDVVIHEVFKDRKVYLAKWIPQRYFRWTEKGFFCRRQAPSEVHLRIITKHRPPVGFVLQRSNGVVIGGLLGEVWRMLQKTMNFRATTIDIRNDSMVEDVTIGREGNFSTWEIMDLSLIDVTQMQYLHRTDLRFTAPLFITRMQIVIRQPVVHQSAWNSFLAPFSTNLWLVILFFILLGTVCVVVLLWFQSAREPPIYSLSRAFLAVFGVFCQQSPDINTTSLSSRIVFLVLHLTTTVLLAGYSASVISSLAVRLKPLPFDSIEGLLKDGTYKFSTAIDGAGMYIAKNSKDPTLKKLFVPHSFNHSLPNTTMEGINKVCSSKTAFFSQQERVWGLQGDFPCRIVFLPNFSIQLNVALAVDRKFTLLRLLNHNINTMHRGGLIRRYIFKMMKKYSTETPVVFSSVKMKNIIPLLMCFLTGCVLSLTILLIERLVRR